MKTRYFIISYLYGDNGIGTGNLGIKTNMFPNIHQIRKESKEKKVTVINILEVSKEDYDFFWRDDEK